VGERLNRIASPFIRHQGFLTGPLLPDPVLAKKAEHFALYQRVRDQRGANKHIPDGISLSPNTIAHQEKIASTGCSI